MKQICIGYLVVLIMKKVIVVGIPHIENNLLIHRDIKPENLAVGVGKRANMIYLLDFGLLKQYKNPTTKSHIPYKDKKIGSLGYSSFNAHLGIEQSRRDDLESLGYVFIYLLKGRLPWEGLIANSKTEHFNKVIEVMTNTSIDSLTERLPSM